MLALLMWTVGSARASTIPGSTLQALVDAAVVSKASSVVLPPGDYTFNTTKQNFQIHNASSLNILATGVTVWLWPGHFVDIRDSQSSSMSGLTVDFNPPCFSQGKVVSVDPASHSFQLDVEDGFLPPNIDASPQFNATEVKVIYWDAETKTLLHQPSANPWNPVKSKCVGGSNCTIVLGSIRNPLPPKGGLVTIGPRIGAGMVIQSWYSSGYRCTNCSQFLTDNVTMHGSGSMGFGEFGGEGANVYRNCRNVRRPGSTHLLSSNHDGFHSSDDAYCKVGPTLDNVEIGFCGDDALNIHSVFSLVLKNVPTPATPVPATVAASHANVGANSSADVHASASTGSKLYIVDAGLPDAFSFNARVGDVAEFYNVQSVAYGGARTVTSIAEVTDNVILQEAHDAMMNINAQCKGGCGLFNCSGICGFHYDVNIVWEVGFEEHERRHESDNNVGNTGREGHRFGGFGGSDGAGPAISNFDLVQVKERSSAGATIKNSHFHDAYDGVMQFRSSNAVIANNVFERAHGLSVATAKSWLEGAAGLRNVVVDNNTFVACCSGGDTRGGDGRSMVLGQDQDGGCNPVHFSGCENCVAKNNTVRKRIRH